MKLLKLDARFEDARRVARCLVDSPIESVIGANYFRGITNYYGIDSMIHHGFVTSFLHVEKEIKLPIDTLKFCPFTAMRERVSVLSVRGELLARGRITEIDDSECVQIGWDHRTTHFLHEITLDLTPILQGELEGCEIVESN